jgi:hypothetical protein
MDNCGITAYTNNLDNIWTSGVCAPHNAPFKNARSEVYIVASSGKGFRHTFRLFEADDCVRIFFIADGLVIRTGKSSISALDVVTYIFSEKLREKLARLTDCQQKYGYKIDANADKHHPNAQYHPHPGNDRLVLR